MKMRKKYIKKLNILNRSTYINFYSNFFIFNYLNNHNLKLFFKFLGKKVYYFQILKKIKNLFIRSFVNSKLFNKQNLVIGKNSFYLKNYRNKFFNTSAIKAQPISLNCNISLNAQLEKGLAPNFFIKSRDNRNLIIKDTANWYNSSKLDLKYLLTLLFVLNLLKVLETYKLLINLNYYSVVFKI